MVGVHLRRETKLANETDCRRRQALESGKNAKPTLRGSLSLDKECPHKGSALSRAVETASDSTLLWQHVPTRSAVLDAAAPALL